jgi:hypothetical protein
MTSGRPYQTATAAAKCLGDDLDALVVHLRYPRRHRQVAVDLAARTVTGRAQTPHQGDRPLPGETSWLTLVWAVLDLYITHAKHGVRFSQLERHARAG